MCKQDIDDIMKRERREGKGRGRGRIEEDMTLHVGRMGDVISGIVCFLVTIIVNY